MSNKRSADKDLNHDNWDQEDESEEAGVFRHASKEVIQKREIKKAKRRVHEDESSGAGSGSSALKEFKFGASVAPFSFAPQMNTTSGDTSKAAFSTFKFSSTPLSTAAVSTAASDLASPSKNPLKSSAEVKAKESDSEYRNSLRNLNESVLRWITDHVKKNPYCILSPVFSDYEKYIKQFESDFLGGSVSKSTPSFSFGSSPLASTSTVTTTTTQAPAFGAGFFSASAKPSESVAVSSTVATATGFSFGATTTGISTSGFGSGVGAAGGSSVPLFTFGVQSSRDVAPKPSAGFGQSTVETPGASSAGAAFSTATSGEAPSTSKPFSFGSSSTVGSSSGSVLGGFVFGSSKPSTSAVENDAAQETSQAEGDDGNYVPPKPEVVDVQEDDAFHTVRCKLFFKIGNEFKDRGIGNLYLKPCGEKTQLLVRAGTALGNILLNIMLSKGIPSSRQGNKVTMVCIPNPPLSEKDVDVKTPICIVFRVKTDDEAEALLKQINDHKA